MSCPPFDDARPAETSALPAVAEATIPSLHALSLRLRDLANSIVTTEYALEARSIAGAIDAQADRLAAALAD